MEIRFDGKTAVVTGAGRGLGREIALTLARSGADIVVGDIQSALVDRTCGEIAALGRRAYPSVVDVSDLMQVEALMQCASRVDIVVNGAGIMVPEGLLTAEPEKVCRLLNINVLGSSNVARCAIQKMMPQGSGKILLVASVAGKQAGDNMSHYRASKSAVISLAMSAACTAAPYRINVNAICPGIIRTPMWEQILDAKVKETGRDRECLWQDIIGSKIPLGRAQTEANIANMAAVLCSDLASEVTGQAISVDGGQVMCF